MRGLSGRFCAVSGAAHGSWGLHDAPLTIVGASGTPVPYAGPLEVAWLQAADGTVADARKLVAY